MRDVASHGPARAFLLAALGLPSCGTVSPAGNVRLETTLASDSAHAGSGSGGTDAKEGSRCRVSETSRSGEVSCARVSVEVHRDSLEPCGAPGQCEAPEVCASTPPGSLHLACRRVPRSGDACESAHDCPPGETCLAEGDGQARCVVDACGLGCPDGQSCAVTLDRFTREADSPVPSPPSDGPTQLGCFPRGATSHARPYMSRSPCDPQGSDPCALDGGRWVCQRSISMRPCGRPMVIDGETVVARGGASQGWSDGARELCGDAHPELAHRMRRIAFEEHASIACFGRTVAMLSALGAPAHLLAATSRALSDEIEHARQAFDLARRFGATKHAPGPFPEAIAPFPPQAQLAESLLADVIIGGCVGESLAVLEAEALRLTAPAEAHAFFERVIADEARHAELAFTTARWLLEREPSLASVAFDAVGRALDRFGVAHDAPWPAEVERLSRRAA